MKNKNIKFTNKVAAVLLSFVFVAVLSIPFVTPKTYASDIDPVNITILVNRERINNGLAPLKVNYELTSAAEAKSTDMIQRHYFDHYALGLTPWMFIKNANYNYQYAGENLAMDFETSEGMVSAWMNSPAHRANILNPKYEEIGIGVVKGAYSENNVAHETIMVTNMFGSEKPSYTKVLETIKAGFNELIKSL